MNGRESGKPAEKTGGMGLEGFPRRWEKREAARRDVALFPIGPPL
jgi:hypothetical protein